MTTLKATFTLAFTVTLLLAIAVPAFAATWNGGSGNWNDGGNWNTHANYIWLNLDSLVIHPLNALLPNKSMCVFLEISSLEIVDRTLYGGAFFQILRHF